MSTSADMLLGLDVETLDVDKGARLAAGWRVRLLAIESPLARVSDRRLSASLPSVLSQTNAPCSRIFALLLLLLMALPVMACGARSGCSAQSGCGKDRNLVFEQPADKPRGAMIVVKSYRGSRENLVDAAGTLMARNPRFGEFKEGSDVMFLKAEGEEPAFAVAATTFKTTSSIAELLGLMRAVKERLTPRGEAPTRYPTIEIELWWVEGVHETGLGIELPNPLMLEERWANQLFAAGASNYAVHAGEEGRERRGWLGKIARMHESYVGGRADPRLAEPGSVLGTYLSAKDGFVVYEAVGLDVPDVLAQAVNTTLVGDVHLSEVARANPKFAYPDLDLQRDLAGEIVERRDWSWVEPVEALLSPGESLAEQAQHWIDACRQASKVGGLATGKAVVFEAKATAIHGAILGEKVDPQELLPNALFDASPEAKHFESPPGHWRYLIALKIETPPTREAETTNNLVSPTGRSN